MKIVKLLDNVTKGKIENNAKIKVDNDIEIIYRYDQYSQKHYFEDTRGQEINILDFIGSNFELIVERTNNDIWDDVYQALNPNAGDNSNVERGIGTSGEPNEKIPTFTLSLLTKSNKENSDTDGIIFYDDELSDYSYEPNQIIGFYNTAEGYYDAALTIIEDYGTRFEKLFDLGNSNKNSASYGYHQDSIIRTLLAFSCECYLKSLLLSRGKKLSDLKSLNHGLIDLYHALDTDTLSAIFLDMENNGYDILTYNSDKIRYDNPDLTEKFMIDLGTVDDAFVESRYCAEKDKNTNYGFLYRFAKSLKHITEEKLQINSVFNDGKHIKK